MLAAGLSPQVVTETVYALAVARRPRWIPDEVHLYTTLEGAERAKLSLLPSGADWFGRLREEYSLPAIRFTESEIHVLKDRKGRGMVDIRTGEDNEAAANGLAAAVRNVTADDGTEVHVSIAGGRKTMGFFAGYALSLFGRPQDRLSHVLVEPAWESHPEFFYPTVRSRIIYSPPPGSRPLDTAMAKVSLAEIPFVRLGEVGAGAGARRTYRGAVRQKQESLRELQAMVLDFESRQLRVGSVIVRMAPAELAFAAFLMRRVVEGREPVECPGEGPDQKLAEAYLHEYRMLERRGGERTEKALRGGMDGGFFLQRRARYEAALRQALGERCQPYRVQTSGRRPATRYGLGIGRERIRMIGEAQAS